VRSLTLLLRVYTFLSAALTLLHLLPNASSLLRILLRIALQNSHQLLALAAGVVLFGVKTHRIDHPHAPTADRLGGFPVVQQQRFTPKRKSP
jgi:hypothetical protein